ncbi:MAG: hypothetical protein ACTTJZ_03660 [Sphaerochaetaceae bacterium]
MKRFAFTVILAVAVVFSVFPVVMDSHLGGWVSMGGRSDSVLQTAAGASFYVFHGNHMTPFAFCEAFIQLSDTALGFGGFRAGLGLELMYMKNHHFMFLTANPTVWSPAVLCGWCREGGSSLMHLQLSLFRFMEKDAVYEYLVPFCDLGAGGIDALGILLFRFSGLF